MADVLVAVAPYQEQLRTVRQRVLDYVTKAWDGLGTYHTPDIERFATAAAAAVNGGQVKIAALTDGYLAALESVVYGPRVRPVGIPKDMIAGLRGGADPLEVYTRPGVTTWGQLAAGAALAVAVDAGRNRLREITATDLQLAKTHAARHVLAGKANVSSFRRTLNSSDPCELCLDASSETYRTGELMPIHPTCDCDIEPIFDGVATPSPTELDDQPAPSSDTGPGASVVHEHGEIGPMLAHKGQHFSGPEDS